MPLRLSKCSVLAAILTAASCAAQAPAANDLPPAAADAYRKAADAERQSFFDIALDKYQAALKLAPNSELCMESVVRVYTAMGDDKSALAAAVKMTAAAANPLTRAHAEALQAGIYYRQSTAYADGTGAYEKDPKKSQDTLRKAEAIMAHAIQDDPHNEPLHLRYAHVLARLHRDPDAAREFAACAAIPGTAPAECARALRLSSHLDIARLEPAPAFTARTLDGKTVSLDDLSGKVVLIDFWGTWCKYCVRDASYVQSLLNSFDEKSFVLLEVNEGDSTEKWSAYVKAEHLQGVQTHDDSEQLQSLFHVTAFPTYVIVDGDGIIRKRYQGAVGDLRGEVRKLIPARPSTADATGTN